MYVACFTNNNLLVLGVITVANCVLTTNLTCGLLIALFLKDLRYK